MKRQSATIRDWAELARISNLPTVVTNVLVGLAIGFIASAQSGMYALVPETDRQLLRVVLEEGGYAIIAAVMLFYIAGMMLNDVFDQSIDLAEQPRRPLPSGRIPAWQAIAVLTACAMAGVGLLLWLGHFDVLVWAGALALAIVLYDLLHKRFSASVWLMGACRACVYFTAAAAFPAVHTLTWWENVTPLAVMIALYTVGITFIARTENEKYTDMRRWLAPVMIVLVLGGVLIVAPTDAPDWIVAAIMATGVLLWLGRGAWLMMRQPPRTRAAVMTFLSGMCLVDGFFLALMARPVFALAAVICFIAAAVAHRRISGT